MKKKIPLAQKVILKDIVRKIAKSLTRKSKVRNSRFEQKVLG